MSIIDMGELAPTPAVLIAGPADGMRVQTEGDSQKVFIQQRPDLPLRGFEPDDRVGPDSLVEVVNHEYLRVYPSVYVYKPHYHKYLRRALVGRVSVGAHQTYEGEYTAESVYEIIRMHVDRMLVDPTPVIPSTIHVSWERDFSLGMVEYRLQALAHKTLA